MTPTSRTTASILVALVALATLAVLSTAPVAAQGAPAGDDICFPDKFFVENSIYLPDSPNFALSPQYFDLARGRERFDTFQTPVETVSFIDDYPTNSRFILIGTHENMQNIVFHTCFPAVLDRELEPICWVEGTERQRSTSIGALPVHQSTLVSDPTGCPMLVEFDTRWTQIGSVRVPLLVVERQCGSSLQFILLENFRFDFDPSALDIPDICLTAPVRSAAPVHPRDVFPDGVWDEMRHVYPYRRFDPDGDGDGDGDGDRE